MTDIDKKEIMTDESLNEEYQVECGECGNVFNTLHQYEIHYVSMHDCGNSNNCEKQDTLLRTENSEDKVTEDNFTSKLAEAVQARPVLWDHTLPLKSRTKDIKEKLWRQVYKELKGIIPLDQLEKKWKNLKDTFLKHFRTYKPTGTSTDDKKKWKHFDLLFFLAEKNLPKTTIGNFPHDSTSNDSLLLLSPGEMSSGATDLRCQVTPTTTKRQKKSDDTDQLLLNILKEPLPMRSGPSVCPALLTVQSVLDKLPSRIRMEAEIEILNKVYSLYSKYCTNSE